MSSNVEALEQLGEVSPLIPSTTGDATSSQTSSEGMLTAPLFLGLSDSLTQSRAVDRLDRTVNSHRTPVFQSVSAPIVALGIGSSFTQAYILGLGLGRTPVFAKLVLQILTGKFIELSELIPENLASPTTNPPPLPLKVARLCPRLRRCSRKPKLGIYLYFRHCSISPKTFAIYSLIWP